MNFSMQYGNKYFVRYLDKPAICHPEVVSISLTDKCNLHCPYCYANASVNHNTYLSLNTIDHIFATFFKQFPYQVVLGGGEPCYNPELIDIVKYFKQHNCAVSITTNGTTLLKTPELLDLCDGISISLHDNIKLVDDSMNMLKVFKGQKSVQTFNVNKLKDADCAYPWLDYVVLLKYRSHGRGRYYNYTQQLDYKLLNQFRHPLLMSNDFSRTEYHQISFVHVHIDGSIALSSFEHGEPIDKYDDILSFMTAKSVVVADDLYFHNFIQCNHSTYLYTVYSNILPSTAYYEVLDRYPEIDPERLKAIVPEHTAAGVTNWNAEASECKKQFLYDDIYLLWSEDWSDGGIQVMYSRPGLDIAVELLNDDDIEFVELGSTEV